MASRPKNSKTSPDKLSASNRPKPKLVRRHLISDKQVEIFLRSLMEVPNVTAALKSAGLHESMQAVYMKRTKEPEFAKAWLEALAVGYDNLEAEAVRRAHSGVVEPVYQGGVKVGDITRYSDNLMMFLLRGNKAQTYREKLAESNEIVVTVKNAPPDDPLA